MKRGRGVSNAARTLSSATAQGIISNEQKLWLRSVLAEGDPVVEEALDQAALGNPQPLRDLAHGGNMSLRARLQTLSKDGEFQRLSFSRNQSTEGTPNILDLEMLADDLRLSSLSNPEDNLDGDFGDDVVGGGGNGENGPDGGFDLEALLDEVTGMMTATSEPTTHLNTLQEDGQSLSSDLELDFSFNNFTPPPGNSGDNGSERHSSIDGGTDHGDGASMISSSSDGGGVRGNLSIRGSLLLAQMRARESFTGSRSLNDSNVLSMNQMSEMNDGINLAIIDDYFVDDNTTTSRNTELDSIDRNMLAVLAQEDDTLSPQQTKFKFGHNPSRNQIWSAEEPPPPPQGPFELRGSPSRFNGNQVGTSSQQPFFMFGSCTTGGEGGGGSFNGQQQAQQPQQQQQQWNNRGAAQMMVPPYGTPPASMMSSNGASNGMANGQFSASWSPGMDQLHVMQMQHRAKMMQMSGRGNGGGVVDTHFFNRENSNKRAASQRSNELCGRLDGLRLQISSQQRELIFLILNRDDRFLTKQFESAISDAEKGKPELLIDLITKAETMSSNLKEVGSLSTSSVKSNGSDRSNGSSTSGQSRSGGGGIGGALRKSSADDEIIEFQNTLASATAASASLDKELLEEHIGILEALVAKKKASAVKLRDAKVFDGALKVMKELKQVQCLLDTCKARLKLAIESNDDQSSDRGISNDGEMTEGVN